MKFTARVIMFYVYENHKKNKSQVMLIILIKF